MSIKIEKGVPLTRKIQDRKYPFGQMEVGDSFTVPEAGWKLVRAASYAFYRYHPEVKFTTRRQDDGSIRVWRIK